MQQRCGNCGGCLIVDEDYEEGVFVRSSKCMACGFSPDAPTRRPTQAERAEVQGTQRNRTSNIGYRGGRLVVHTREQRERINDLARQERAERAARVAARAI